MSQSQCASALVSVRLVVMDHYMANPVHSLDPLVSDFRGTQVRKVPVLRVFGSTPAGQTCCLHLHGIFPYMYVPMPRGEGQGFVYRLATSLDKAINISMNQGNSGLQHVYRALEVSGRPMYGYHPTRSLKSTTTATMVGGPQEFGGTKGMLLYLLVPPRSLFCPSNSVYSPPQTIVLSPQIPNHLLSPKNNFSVSLNSVSGRPQNHSVPPKVNCPPLYMYLPRNSE